MDLRNPDRSTGNPNLLWDADKDVLVVIDHNQALGRDFDPAAFLQHHVFAQQWPGMTGAASMREQFAHRLTAALPAAEKACKTAPEAWLWENSEFDLPARFDPAMALAALARCKTPELWKTV